MSDTPAFAMPELNFGMPKAQPVNDYGASYVNGMQYGQQPQYGMNTGGLGGSGGVAGQGWGGDSWWGSKAMLGGTEADGVKTGGWVSPALNTFTGLTSAWLGMQQYGLAKDALKESKKQFKANYNNQAQLTNTQMEDRQRARVQSAGGNTKAYQSVGDYMDKNKVEDYG